MIEGWKKWKQGATWRIASDVDMREDELSLHFNVRTVLYLQYLTDPAVSSHLILMVPVPPNVPSLPIFCMGEVRGFQAELDNVFWWCCSTKHLSLWLKRLALTPLPHDLCSFASFPSFFCEYSGSLSLFPTVQRCKSLELSRVPFLCFSYVGKQSIDKLPRPVQVVAMTSPVAKPLAPPTSIVRNDEQSSIPKRLTLYLGPWDGCRVGSWEPKLCGMYLWMYLSDFPGVWTHGRQVQRWPVLRKEGAIAPQRASRTAWRSAQCPAHRHRGWGNWRVGPPWLRI